MNTMHNQPNGKLMSNMELFLSNSFPFLFINQFLFPQGYDDKESVNNQCNLST